MRDQFDEDSEVPDAGPLVDNQVRQCPEPEPESNNGQGSGPSISTLEESLGELSVTNPSLPTESSIETELTAPKRTEDQSAVCTPCNIHPPRPSVPGRGQHGWSSGTFQPRQHHVDKQRFALPLPLRSPPPQSARPRHVSQPVSRLSVDLHQPSLENVSENDPLADHRGCPQECRSHSYSAVLFYAVGDEELAHTVRKQLQMLQVSHLGVQGRRVRVALFPYVSPSSTPAETFLEILKNDITPYIFILRTTQYQNSDGDNKFSDWMIAQAVTRSLSIIQIDFEQQKFEKPCLTKLILYDNNSHLFQNHMRELLRGRFLDKQVKHDDVRNTCKHSRTANIGPMLPTGFLGSEVPSQTPPPKAPYDKRRKIKPRQCNKKIVPKDMKEETSATSSSGHQGDISNNSDTEPVSSSETERRSGSSDDRERPSSAENGSKGPGNNRPQKTVCPEENGGHLNLADSRSRAAPTDSGSNYIPLQPENDNSRDTQSSRVSNTKEDIIHFNRVSSRQSSESAVSDEDRLRQVKNDKRQINHFNSSSNNIQKQNLPVRDESSSGPDVASDSGSCSIKSKTVHEKPDAEKTDGHLQFSCSFLATHSLLENAQDRIQRAQESATSLPSSGNRPSEFPQSKPVAVVFPRAPQNEDQTVNDENTLRKSYVREARHETDISFDRQNRAGCEQDPHNSVNPNRTVTFQEYINGRVRHNDTHQQHIFCPQQFNTIPQQNTVSPQQTNASSRQHHVSPEQLIVSPEQRNASTHQLTIRTQQHIVSPQHHTVSQGQDLSSSQQHNSSPGQHAVSHQEHNTSPQQDNENPQQQHTISEHHIVSPQEHNASFQQHTVSPQEHNISSQQHTVSPDEHNTSFQQHIVRPQEHHTSPQGHTASLEHPSTCPQQYTCGPQQDASPRNSGASLPEEISTSHILDKNGSSPAKATSPPEVEDAGVRNCRVQLIDHAARRRCRLWERVRSLFACAPCKKRRSRRRSGETD